jgi:beta-phosphoglucomutase
MTIIEAVFVDFDGTLVDSERVNILAYIDALSCFGYEASYKQMKEMIDGQHWSYFLPKILKDGYSQELSLQIVNLKREIFLKNIGEIKINQDLISLLKKLDQSITRAIVTNASRKSVTSILELNKIDTIFSGIICSEDVSKPKPNPECYLYALSKFNISKEKAMAIEDSECGVSAAKAAEISVLKISPYFN